VSRLLSGVVRPDGDGAGHELRPARLVRLL